VKKRGCYHLVEKNGGEERKRVGIKGGRRKRRDEKKKGAQ